jgi:hypothetical protein
VAGNRTTSLRAWGALVATARGAFGAASFSVFQTLLCGWVLAPGAGPSPR